MRSACVAACRVRLGDAVQLGCQKSLVFNKAR